VPLKAEVCRHLSVAASLVSVSSIVAARLCPESAARLRAGRLSSAVLALGSDWPISTPNVFEEMQVAVTRQVIGDGPVQFHRVGKRVQMLWRNTRFTAQQDPDIRRAVEQLFKVSVTEVRTLVVRGKVKRVGRFSGQRPSWKKAFVTLKPGDNIEFFEGV